MDRRCGKGAVLTPTIRTVAETGSTNADMLLLARAGVEEGVWLRAERQTGGRGRQGRLWVSLSGNFYGSTVVRLRRSDPAAATLALVAAVAVEEAVGIYLPSFPGEGRGPVAKVDIIKPSAVDSNVSQPRPASAGEPPLNDRRSNGLTICCSTARNSPGSFSNAPRTQWSSASA